jgi:TRAP-type mannitol/chloroaromatic compound transport system permease small subunit
VIMKKVLRVIDSISRWSGLIARWGCLALVLILCFEVMMRYVFDNPTIWAHESSTMLGVFIVTIGWSYVHSKRGHVRVDVFYARMSPRGKAIIDVCCFLVFFLPLLLVLIYAAGKMMWEAYIFNEVLMQSYWYPPALPIRTVVVIGLCTFLLQGFADFTRDAYLLVKGAPID